MSKEDSCHSSSLYSHKYPSRGWNSHPVFSMMLTLRAVSLCFGLFNNDWSNAIIFNTNNPSPGRGCSGFLFGCCLTTSPDLLCLPSLVQTLTCMGDGLCECQVAYCHKPHNDCGTAVSVCNIWFYIHSSHDDFQSPALPHPRVPHPPSLSSSESLQAVNSQGCVQSEG